jgi:hypothetical protein
MTCRRRSMRQPDNCPKNLAGAGMELSDLWGLAGRLAQRLKALGMNTPLDLRDADPGFVRGQTASCSSSHARAAGSGRRLRGARGRECVGSTSRRPTWSCSSKPTSQASFKPAIVRQGKRPSPEFAPPRRLVYGSPPSGAVTKRPCSRRGVFNDPKQKFDCETGTF